MQTQDVKAIADEDDAIVMTQDEKELLAPGQGRVLLFYLSVIIGLLITDY